MNCAERLREDMNCTDCDQIIDNVDTFQLLVWKLEYQIEKRHRNEIERKVISKR